MNWESEGFILSKRKFKENAIILEVFTSDFGKVSGIVYGGTSRKVRNYLQLVNKIYVNYTFKNENKIGYFKTELIDAIAPKYFNNKNKILCLNSITSILKLLLPENQKLYNVYVSLDSFLNNLNNENWLINYLNWELDLISNLGYGFDASKFNKDFEKKNFNIVIDKYEYNIPTFLLSKNISKISFKEIYKGLIFSRRLMENKFFIPNDIKFPQSRRIFENKFLRVN